MSARDVDALKAARRAMFVGRLWNWGRFKWRDLMSGRPDGACLNPLYEMMVSDGEGYADDSETGLTAVAVIVALRTEPAKAEPPEIDEEDAENLDGWIRQLAQHHRSLLSRRYVTREPINVDPSIRELQRLMDENRTVVARIRMLQNG